jgi:hypothetical protein
MTKINFGYSVDVITKDTVNIHKVCAVTGERYMVTVTEMEWELFKSRDLVSQDIWPDMTLDNREFIISALTPAEWDWIQGDTAFGKYVENLNT